MKRSNLGRASALGRASLAAVLIGLGATAVSMGSFGGAALAQESTYQPWAATQAQSSQTSDQKLNSLVTDLNALIKKAETANAADPNFIADLKKLAAKYPVTGAKPSTAGQVFLHDTFSDGNYTANPTWKVSAGSWKVDTKGATVGLNSTIGQSTSNKVTGNDVLKAILGVQEQQAPQSTYASIYTAAPMSLLSPIDAPLVSTFQLPAETFQTGLAV